MLPGPRYGGCTWARDRSWDLRRASGLEGVYDSFLAWYARCPDATSVVCRSLSGRRTRCVRSFVEGRGDAVVVRTRGVPTGIPIEEPDHERDPLFRLAHRVSAQALGQCHQRFREADH